MLGLRKRNVTVVDSLIVIGRIHGAIVAATAAATIAATIAPTGCGDDRGDDLPVYTLCIPAIL